MDQDNQPFLVLQHQFAELAQWIKPLCRFKKLEDFLVADYKINRLHLVFYTKNHSYHISACVPGTRIPWTGEKEDKGYLGCTGQTRKPIAGEDWTRGRDLADGSYSEETWKKIVNDIVAYEIVKVVKPKNRGAYLDKDNVLRPANDSSIENQGIRK